MRYVMDLRPAETPPPILADYPEFVEPLVSDHRLLASPLVNDPNGVLAVRAWRWWYNARAILETENRLDPLATAVVVVHPWGIDDGEGLRTPEPAGISFFCTPEKNQIALEHTRKVVRPFLDRLRDRIAVVAYSLPGAEDEERRLLYASIDTPPAALNVVEGQRHWRTRRDVWSFAGDELAGEAQLDPLCPVSSFFQQTPATQTCHRYDRDFREHLPMPLSAALNHHREDLVFYDDAGYPKIRDFLKARGVRHVLLAGYATDMCVARTSSGYEKLCRDFNVFLVGDATLATFPASSTPRFATQAALANAALTQLITQVSWIRFEVDPAPLPKGINP